MSSVFPNVRRSLRTLDLEIRLQPKTSGLNPVVIMDWTVFSHFQTHFPTSIIIVYSKEHGVG